MRRVWRKIRDSLLSPKVDEAEVEACLRAAREQLPVPVFWLLGKAQSGKSSLIRALTGSSKAEIGNGFRPCTRTAQLYDFPNEEECFLRFLDTRGLGETDYDPTDDIRLFEDQAHLLIVVVKAADQAPKSLLESLEKIRAKHPDWPLIVLQTSLHELYPPGTKHIEPYPYHEFPLPPQVPTNLARSLAAQRTWFAGSNAHFVPVDLTLPSDGLPPHDYGLEAIWQAIEESLPLGLQAMLSEATHVRKQLRDKYFWTAHPHILSYSAAAGAVAAGVMIPLVDMPLVLGIQLKMMHAIASIYGQELSRQRIAEFSSILGIGFLGRQASREMVKLIPIPGVGSAAAAAWAAASTYALGCTGCAYFSYVLKGDAPDAEVLKKLYREQLTEGRERFKEYMRHTRRGTKGP